MNCTRCTAETNAEYLCHACAGWLRTVLDRIPDALVTARTTIARLDNVAPSTGRGSGGATSPINLEAASRADHLHALVGSWARLVLEHDSPDMRDVEPITYLSMSVHLILNHEWAGDLTSELDHALKDVLRAVDIPPEVRTYGQCHMHHTDGQRCPGVIRSAGNTTARCRECGETYDPQLIRDHMIGQSWDQPRPLVTIIRALNLEGVTIRIDTAKKWVQRGQLNTNQEDERGVKLYTMGQVLDTARELTATRVKV